MRFLHTMIRVKNLDQSLAFYTDILGMRLQSKQDYPDGKFTLAFVGYGDAKSGNKNNSPTIELTYNWDKEDYVMGDAYGHVALGVADIYKTCDEIRSRGGKIVREPGPMKHGSTIIAFIEDPNGYKIELIETKN